MGNAKGYALPEKAEKFASSRRVERTLTRKLEPSAPAGKTPNYLLKGKRPRKLAMKEKDKRHYSTGSSRDSHGSRYLRTQEQGTLREL